jgi:hypothetical protein
MQILGLFLLAILSVPAQAQLISELKAEVQREAVAVYEGLYADYQSSTAVATARIAEQSQTLKALEQKRAEQLAAHEAARRDCLTLPSPVASARCLSAEDATHSAALEESDARLKQVRVAIWTLENEMRTTFARLSAAQEPAIRALALRNQGALEGLLFLTQYRTGLGTANLSYHTGFASERLLTGASGDRISFDAGETYEEDGNIWAVFKDRDRTLTYRVTFFDLKRCPTPVLLSRMLNLEGKDSLEWSDLPVATVSPESRGFFHEQMPLDPRDVARCPSLQLDYTGH